MQREWLARVGVLELRAPSLLLYKVLAAAIALQGQTTSVLFKLWTRTKKDGKVNVLSCLC